MKRVNIFFIVTALIAGMVGCGPAAYTLVITSTDGGDGTCVPAAGCTCGEGTESSGGLSVPEECLCVEGTVVNLVAEAEEGYCFDNWTGDVGTIASVNSATTTITMNDNYSITANFAKAIEIWNWYDLDAVRDNLSGNCALMNDLDSTTTGYEELASPIANEGKGWQPIGIEDSPFTGAFYGQGYEICDLIINRHNEDYVGLFGAVHEEGVIKDIGVTNVTVIGDHFVGGLVGHNNGIVTDSYSTGNVSGIWCVGGLVGGNYHAGTVSSSYSTASVTAISWPYTSKAGGLVGGNSYGGAVTNSYSTGSVTGGRYVGGLAGVNGWDSTVSDSYSTGSVTGDMDAGGLVGHTGDGATVSNSFWDTETSGQSTSDGGRGKNTTEMQNIATFSGAGWNIIAVALNETGPAYMWNIVNNVTYPFLSWQW